MAILETIGVGKHFGGLMANNDISCRFEEGNITSIIGPNGAGKTTFFNILSGFYKPDAGKIFYEGEEITGMPIHKIVRLGITRSFQILNIFSEISPAENIRLAIQFRKNRGFNWFKSARGFDDINRETAEVLDEIELSDVRNEPTKNLSYGDKRVLEIGIALASNRNCSSWMNLPAVFQPRRQSASRNS